MHQALTQVAKPDPHHPAAARAGRRLRGRGLRPHHRQGGVCVAHQSGPGRPTSSPAWPTPRWTRCPIVAITGQVATHVIGTDAFQETPIVEVCRAITKHHYLVHAHRGHRPGRQGGVPHRQHRPARPGHHRRAQGRAERARSSPRLRRADEPARLPAVPHAPRGRSSSQVLAAIRPSKKPIIYAGGGVIARRAPPRSCASSPSKTGIPVALTAARPRRLPQRPLPVPATCSACTARSTPTTPSTRPTCCWPSASASTTA